ncbi:NAD(P)/FAD-dependent oxidoreductase [Limnohabitans planktonicus]|uniref:Amino acid dehydrogenase n=2 Tax=Limnohabitans planktonicus II-D5 TaxID=1293045 RepID=A0A2T7UCE0_9BURK|nr:FAD-binding oxidoreductase [Limnohabitans planktonicus]PVE42282.1 amino acid dehydrogenase [Limnohabitans planktonicus II-D5]|eukprot:gene1146-1123_t
MTSSILVVGAGMVGTCTALHLQQRGFEVLLLDRRAPGQETSFGNAGLIQREAVEPYAFPREPGFLLNAALGRGAEVNWHARGLWQMGGSLLRYFRQSSPAAHARATEAYSRLIAHATDEHELLLNAAVAQDLVKRDGFRLVFHTHQALDEAVQRAALLQARFGVRHQAESSAQLAQAEPALRLPLAGAVHWLDPWAVQDPGALVQRYADLFVARGGRLLKGEATGFQAQGAGWSVQTPEGRVQAEQAVLALGPWADGVIRTLGYRFPLFVKRGYHQHYRAPVALRQPLLDAERGYVLAPMQRGLRLTTGAEFAPLDAPPTPVQLAKAEALARQLLDLGEPLPEPPWMGARPCTADMLPVMGPAPRHKGLWFNFGHAHQGFTLGPVAGRLLAEMVHGQHPWIDPAPYLPARFG